MLNQEGCVWLVIPVHNRRSITMRCLGNLKSCGVFAWARAVVVDDGSTDGTSDAIRAEYQDLPLTILRGDGNLWWTGAIELGMRFALERGATAVIWLNDDCFPAAGSLRLLADLALTGRCATTTQARTLIGTYYGGYEKYPLGLRRVICPAGVKTLACDASNGNCVCFPRAIIEKIGFPDAAAFPQNHGDSDYTLRVTEAGFACLIVGEAACVNELEGPPALRILVADQRFGAGALEVLLPLEKPVALRFVGQTQSAPLGTVARERPFSPALSAIRIDRDRASFDPTRFANSGLRPAVSLLADDSSQRAA